MQPVLVLELLILLAVANGTPVVAKRLFGGAFAELLLDGRVLADHRQEVASARVQVRRRRNGAPIANEPAEGHRLGMGGATRRDSGGSASAELMVDPESGARCAIRRAGGGRHCA